MHYADFGAGGLGHFVFPASELVGPEGLVYAVDILKSALEAIERRARDEQVDNLHLVWGDIEKVGGMRIPEHSLDVASYVNVAPVLKKSPGAIEEARRLLKPKARLFIVGWKPGAGTIVVPESKRVAATDIQAIVDQSGMKLLSAFDAGPQHWGLLYENA